MKPIKLRAEAENPASGASYACWGGMGEKLAAGEDSPGSRHRAKRFASNTIGFESEPIHSLAAEASRRDGRGRRHKTWDGSNPPDFSGHPFKVAASVPATAMPAVTAPMRGMPALVPAPAPSATARGQTLAEAMRASDDNKQQHQLVPAAAPEVLTDGNPTLIAVSRPVTGIATCAQPQYAMSAAPPQAMMPVVAFQGQTIPAGYVPAPQQPSYVYAQPQQVSLPYYAADPNTFAGGRGNLARPCKACRTSRVKCDYLLPCSRCIRLGVGAQCAPPPTVQRGRPSHASRLLQLAGQREKQQPEQQQEEEQPEQQQAHEEYQHLQQPTTGTGAGTTPGADTGTGTGGRAENVPSDLGGEALSGGYFYLPEVYDDQQSAVADAADADGDASVDSLNPSAAPGGVDKDICTEEEAPRTAGAEVVQSAPPRGDGREQAMQPGESYAQEQGTACVDVPPEVDHALQEVRAAEHLVMVRRMEALRAQLRSIGIEPCA